MADATFQSLVQQISEREHRQVVVLDRKRLHDVVGEVVAGLLEEGDLFQYDSTLAVTFDDKHAKRVTAQWLKDYIVNHFKFLDRQGTLAEPPPAVVKIVLERCWSQFPDFQSDVSISKPRKRRRRSGAIK